LTNEGKEKGMGVYVFYW